MSKQMLLKKGLNGRFTEKQTTLILSGIRTSKLSKFFDKTNGQMSSCRATLGKKFTKKTKKQAPYKNIKLTEKEEEKLIQDYIDNYNNPSHNTSEISKKKIEKTKGLTTTQVVPQNFLIPGKPNKASFSNITDVLKAVEAVKEIKSLKFNENEPNYEIFF